MRFDLFLLLLSLTGAAHSAEKPSSNKGMWSWSQSAFNSTEAKNKLIQFCGKEGISRVDQHLSIRTKNGKLVFENQLELGELLKSASRAKIDVNALRGDKEMFFAKNHKHTLETLKLIIRFNQSLPKKQRLSGIKYDVEPYLTKEWKAGGAERRKVILDYLECLVKIRAQLKSSNSSLKLHTDVPFWWDEPKHTVAFRGKTQAFTHHIQDLTDAISIMSYRRDAARVLDLSKEELAYANKIGKTNSVSVGLETIKIEGKESFITFHGLPTQKFRNTVTGLQTKLSNNKASAGIMIHQYRSLKSYLK